MAGIQDFFKQLLGSNLDPTVLSDIVGRVDPAKLSEIVDQLRTDNEKSAGGVLISKLPPSTAALYSLRPITLRQLMYDRKHVGKVVYLIIHTTSISRGMNMVVEDSDGIEGSLWSVLEYPCPGGKLAMAEGTVVAIKEPYFGPYVYGDRVISVYSPTDIIRLSRYDDIVRELFPHHAASVYSNFAREGNAAFAAGKLMDAVDIYSEGMRVARDNPCHATNQDSFYALLLKRAFTYTRCNLHAKALLDLTVILITQPTNCKALKLACICSLQLERYQPAQCYASALVALDPKNIDYQRLHSKMTTSLRQASGNYDFEQLTEATKRGQRDVDASSFIGDIEIRRSSLGGRGMFAKRAIQAGELLLCEKPIIVSYDTTSSSYGDGQEADNKGTGRYWMSVIQQLACAVMSNPRKGQQLFDLYAGHKYNPPGRDSKKVEGYDTERAYAILTYNHHLIDHGNASDEQSFFENYSIDGGGSGATLPVSKNTPGLWYATSLFNHSCLANAQHAWIGDLMLVTAMRDIEKDTELTLAYCTSKAPYDQRKQKLSEFGFECSCKLCRAESSLVEAVAARQQLISHIIQYGNIDQLENLLTCIVLSYSATSYGDIPWLELIEPLFIAAHNYMGPIAGWKDVGAEWKEKAHDAFLAIVQLASGIILVQDPISSYCGLLVASMSQPNAYCVAALMAMAEIAYSKGGGPNAKKACALVKCAKSLYKMLYGEDSTFADHYGQYRCRAVFHLIGILRPPANWVKVQEKAAADGCPLPAFLRNRPASYQGGREVGVDELEPQGGVMFSSLEC